jgi:hypothetical protein
LIRKISSPNMEDSTKCSELSFSCSASQAGAAKW